MPMLWWLKVPDLGTLQYLTTCWMLCVTKDTHGVVSGLIQASGMVEGYEPCAGNALVVSCVIDRHGFWSCDAWQQA
jgi:hypothetical protein